MDPAFYVTLENERKQYEQHNNSIENEGYVAMFTNFLDFIQTHSKEKPQSALDFGSGPGPVLAKLLEHQGIQTQIYDPNFAPNKDVLDEKYDLITSTEVIEHLEDPLKTLKELLQSLKVGGYLGIMTQFHPNEKEKFLSWWYPRDPTHICFYTPRTLKQLAKHLDLELVAFDQKSQALFRKSENPI